MGSPSALSPTRCEFRTAQEVVSTPLRDRVGGVLPSTRRDLRLSGAAATERPRSGMRVRIELPGRRDGFAASRSDGLRFYLGGLTDMSLQPARAARRRVHRRSGRRPVDAGDGARVSFLPADQRCSRSATTTTHAMLPVTLRGLSGCGCCRSTSRLAQRFLFFEIVALAPAAWRRPAAAVRARAAVQAPRAGARRRRSSPSNFAAALRAGDQPRLSGAPNGTELNDTTNASTSCPSATAPADYEVFDILSRARLRRMTATSSEFVPLFAAPAPRRRRWPGYFCCRARAAPAQCPTRASDGPRSGPMSASEVFVSLVDPHARAVRDATLAPAGGPGPRCTNRDLPCSFRLGDVDAHLTLTRNAPVESIRVIAGPSRPIAATRDGPMAWRLLSLLSLSYVTLSTKTPTGRWPRRGIARRLRPGCRSGVRRQVEGELLPGADPAHRAPASRAGTDRVRARASTSA